MPFVKSIMISMFHLTFFAFRLSRVSVYVLACLLAIGGCKPAAPESSAGTGDFTGFELTDIPGSTIKIALRKDAAGKTFQEGFVMDNKKTGQWIEFNNEGDIASIENYVNGLLEGSALKMSFRGQVDQKFTYHLGQLHGRWVQHKFGKIIEERNYNMGKLDGVVKTYDDKSWKLRQEAEYKDGLQDGFFRYYDDNGTVTLEYQYKKGEKVSGGMVNKG